MLSSDLQTLLSFLHIHKLSKESVLLKGSSVTYFEVGARYERLHFTDRKDVIFLYFIIFANVPVL